MSDGSAMFREAGMPTAYRFPSNALLNDRFLRLKDSGNGRKMQNST